MKVTIELENKNEIELLMEFFQTLGKNISYEIEENFNFIEKGDKSIDFSNLFEIWESNPVDISSLRKSAWDRS